MRYLLLFLLGYLLYRYMRPLLQKKPENPQVKDSSLKTNENTNQNRKIEDAEFEEIE